MAFTSKIWEDFDQTKIDMVFKGMPLAAQGKSIHEFLKERPNLFSAGFQYPIAIIKKSSLENNVKRMAQFCNDVPASLAPHAKTTMSPQIARMQIDHGAWALTVANFSQASVFLAYGFERIIIANQVVDSETIRAISTKNQTDTCEIIFYLDSIEGLRIIQNALSELPHGQIHILFELGIEGGRGGIRHIEDLSALLEMVRAEPKILIRGVSGFEGAVPGGSRSKEGVQKVREFSAKIVKGAKIVAPYVINDEVILSAGGSAFFDIVAEEFIKFGPRSRIVLRSGAYITHDHGLYESIYPFAQEALTRHFLPAMELWAQVLTQPEAGLAVLNLGKRDVGNDIHNPVPIKKYDNPIEEISAKVDQLNDQHAYMRFSEDLAICVGDLIGMGISHPCTTFDKWKLIPLVDDNYEVVDLIHTYF